MSKFIYQPKRILLLFTIMNRGGAETMVMNYYRNLDRNLVQFDFMVHRAEKGAYDDEIESLGGKIYRMCPVYPQNFIRYKKMLHDFFTIHNEYQIIHSHMSELGYFAFKEAKKQNIPVRICHAHNTPVFSLIGWNERIKALARWYFKKNIQKYTTHFFTCSIDSGKWLFGSENVDKLIVMKNAVPADSHRYNQTVRSEYRKNLKIENKFVLGHVGRFNEQKNHAFLIDIFFEIQKIKPDSTLLLIGDGNLKQSIQQKVNYLGLNKKVLFLGVRNDINELLQAMDVFVLPSLFEGLAMVLIEAQASGLKCFTSKDLVTTESKITNLLEYIPLNENPDIWARYILDYDYTNYRKDMYQEIVDKEWDINSNVKWITEFYLNCSN